MGGILTSLPTLLKYFEVISTLLELGVCTFSPIISPSVVVPVTSTHLGKFVIPMKTHTNRIDVVSKPIGYYILYSNTPSHHILQLLCVFQ